MDETGFCGEQKEAEYIGTGRNIFITVDGEQNPVVITSNARDPKCMGGFEFKLVDAASTSDQPYAFIYNISIKYNMSSEISGKSLTFSASNEDQVSSQTTVQSTDVELVCMYIYM